VASGRTWSGIDSIGAESEAPLGRPIRTGLRRRLPDGGRQSRRHYPTSRNRTGRRSSGRCTPRSGVTSPAGEGSERPPCGQAEPWFLLHLPTLVSPARIVRFDDWHKTNPWALRYGHTNWGAAHILPEAARTLGRGYRAPAGRNRPPRKPLHGGRPRFHLPKRAGRPADHYRERPSRRHERESRAYRPAIVPSCNSICSRSIAGCRLRSFSSALRPVNEAE
jgi:hypothetical protein